MAAQVQLQSADGILVMNELGQALIVTGTAAPTNGQIGFAGGCLYIRQGASPALYNNTGTPTSSTWTAIT